MKLTRKYLTSEEIGVILSEMHKHKSSLEREILKVGLVAQLLIEDLGEYNDCNEIFDKVMEDGIDFDYEINNYYLIDELYKQDTGLEIVVEKFLIELEEKLDNFSKEIPNNEQLQSVVEQFKEMTDNGK